MSANPFMHTTLEHKMWDRIKLVRAGSALSDAALVEVIQEAAIAALDTYGDLDNKRQAIVEETTVKVKGENDELLKEIEKHNKEVRKLIEDGLAGGREQG